MTVYVDPMMTCLPNRNWRWHENCHLLADTVDELHAFAARLGLKRAWFQPSPDSLPHYDLTRNKRAQAVRLGAVEIGREEVARMLAARRAIQEGLPAERRDATV